MDSNFTFNNITDSNFKDGIIISRSNIIIDGNYNTIDGSNQARIFNITGANVIIKNLNFINGNSTNGGAIYITGGNFSIINSTFKRNNANSAGGAIYINGSNGTVTNSTFTENLEENGGGAIYINRGDVTVTNSTFTQNNATKNGGAICIFSGNVTVTNSTLTENLAGEGGGAIYIYIGNVTVTNSTFTQNNAQSGGAIGIYSCNLTVTNSTFTQNNATNGGAIYILSGDVTVTNSTFTQNNATNGGAIRINRGNGTVTNSTFTQNNAENGGAIHLGYGNGTVTNSTFTQNNANTGGAIYISIGNCTVTNSTFTQNNANTGGAIYISIGNGTVTNSTFTQNNAENGGAIYIGPDNNVTVTNSTFTQNNATNNGGAIHISIGNGIVTNVTNSTFTQNNALNGGAINFGYGKGTVTNSTFTQNNAFYGGAIRIYEGNVAVTNSTFTQNNATYDGGAIHIKEGKGTVTNSTFTQNNAATGGAIHIDMGNGTVTNSTFTQNNAYQNGGAIYLEYYNGNVINSTFTQNSATTGGAIYIYKGNGTVTNSTFKRNNAYENGGAIYISRGNGTVTNSTFTQNNATDGGVIYLEYGNGTVINSTFTQNNATYNGGAIYINVRNYNAIVNNGTFFNNTAENGAGIYNEGNLTVSNSTFTNNKANNIALNPDANITVDEYTKEHTEGTLIAKYTNTNAGTINITYGNDGIIAATIYTNESFVESGTVIVVINGKNYTANVVNGIAIITLKDLSAGEYTNIIAKYLSNEDYTSSYTLVDFTVNPQSTNITAPTTSFIVNYDGTYNVTLNPKFAGAIISFVLDGVDLGTATTDENGIASITLTATQLKNIGTGTKILEAKFKGNQNYTGSVASTTIDIIKENTSISAPEASFIINYDGTYNVTLNPKFADAVILFVLDGVDIGFATTDENGIASITLTATQLKNIGTGTKKLEATFTGNDYYTGSVANTTIEITKEATSITAPAASFIVNYDGTYNVTLNPKFAGAIISFVLDGVDLGTATTDENGIASITLTATQLKNIGTGTKKLEATFTGNDYYTGSVANTTIEITKEATSITAPAASFIINYDGTYKVTVNTKVSGANVSFVLNGANIGSAISNANGIASIKITAAQLKKAGAGTKVLEATFAGNDYYTGSVASSKITITKEASKFANVKSAKSSYKANAKTMQLTATLKDSKNKVIKNKVVIFKIKNKTYKVKTNSKGVALLTLNSAKIKACKLNKKGTYKFTVTFNADTYYNKATGKGTLKVVN